MAAVSDCIFCKIVAGEIPCFKLFEDDKTLAFMDINPVHPGHALVIPKAHAENIHAIDPEDLAAVARTAKIVASAIERAVAPEGLTLLQANGPAAGQSVGHLHVHLVPRQMGDGVPMTWGLNPGDMDDIGRVAERIRGAIG